MNNTKRLIIAYTNTEISKIFQISLANIKKYINRHSIVGMTRKNHILYILDDFKNMYSFYSINTTHTNKSTTFFESLIKKYDTDHRKICRLDVNEDDYLLEFNKQLSFLNNASQGDINKYINDPTAWFTNEELKKHNANLEKIRIKREKELIQAELTNNYEQYFKEFYFNSDNANINYIIHVGDTNSGKTYHATNSLKETSGIFLSPLRLLAWEIYEKMNKGLDNPICDLITGEEKILHPDSKIVSATVEMLSISRYYETIVLDEAFMLGDRDRGKSWLRALACARCKTFHIISNKETEHLILKILKSLNRNNVEIKRYNKLVPLEVKTNMNIDKPDKKSLLVCFSRLNVLKYKAIYESRGYNVSILYGNLPPDVKKSEINRFINGETDICVSTDVVGMGLNLPSDNVVFLENEKFDGIERRELNNTEYKQIAGRAGRYLLSEKGYVGGVGVKSIKNALTSCDYLQFAYIGFDYLMVCDILNKSMSEKIGIWENSKFIPTSLSTNIVKESCTKYYQLLNNNVLRIEKYDKHLAWSLLYLPVRENNKEYYESVCNTLVKDQKIKRPSLQRVVPKDSTSLKEAEDSLSDLDLYLYLYNSSVFNKFIVTTEKEIEYITSFKYEMIDNITKFLLDKKMSSIKKCVKCGINIGIDNNHKMCNPCFNEKY